MVNTKIQLIIGGNTLYFPDAHIIWRLEKNIIQFILPMKTDARDIKRSAETFVLKGDFQDDYGQYGDGFTAIDKMELIRTTAKQKRKYHYLVWKGKSFKVWFKSVNFDKAAGEGDSITYTLSMVAVDK